MRLQEFMDKLELIKEKHKLHSKTSVIIDGDKRGWYSLVSVDIFEVDGVEICLNLKSSNEA